MKEGRKDEGEDHRGTCGLWNRVKNENHIMATKKAIHTLLYTAGLI